MHTIYVMSIYLCTLCMHIDMHIHICVVFYDTYIYICIYASESIAISTIQPSSPLQDPGSFDDRVGVLILGTSPSRPKWVTSVFV